MIAAIERLLRGEVADTPRSRTCLMLGMSGCAIAGLALGGASGEPWLGVFAAVKVPVLIAATAGLCLPSFYVCNALLGLRDDFAAACRGLVATQATLGVALGSLATMSVFLSISVADPYALTLFDALLFGVATLAAQKVLARHYAPLIARDRRHRVALRVWLVLYVFTGIQLAWVLRPFRGTEGLPVQFLRPEAFQQNAYVVLLQHFVRVGR